MQPSDRAAICSSPGGEHDAATDLEIWATIRALAPLEPVELAYQPFFSTRTGPQIPSRGCGLSIFFQGKKMANRNIPLVNNAVRHPTVIVGMLKQHPHTLRDESSESLLETSKALVRAGFRAALMEICSEAGLDVARRAIVESVCSGRYAH
jgi:hypothetical protein